MYNHNMQTLPKTKFCAPIPHRELIPRADLTAWLRKELPASRLILLSAPAGYGKTTLLSGLPEAAPEVRLAWLALDGEDNDLVRFLSGLAEALSAVHPQLKQLIEDQIAASTGLVSGSASVVPLRQVMVLLINAVLSLPAPACILALDDLQEITSPAIFEALDYLLENLPPQMHLAVATRSEPPLRLQRLRARRQLAELKMADLRFDLGESQRFLNDLLGLGLSEADLQALQQKTEGWPVGLVLLTERLRDLPPLPERAEFLRRLEHIDPTTFRYLADEVLAQQPEPLRTFLLETSILAELSPSACRAVTGREDAAGLLAELRRRNLFLAQVREGSTGQEAVYRYHALFAEFLQVELERSDAARWRELQRRAAQAEEEPGRAIGHLLAARDWQAAAAQIERVGEQSLQDGLQATVSGWIAALPAELAAGRYRLMYLRGLSGLLEGDLEEARRSLEQSLDLLGAGQDRVTRGQVLVGLASLAFVRAEFARCGELVQQAEPWVEGLQERIDFLMLRASLALFCASDGARAEGDLREALALVRSSEDARLWFLFSLYLAPEFTVLPGMLDLLEGFCQQASLRYGQQATPLRLGVEDTWASVHLRRGRLRQAIETGRDALLVKEQLGGYPFLGLNASLTVAAAYSGLGNYPAAEEYLRRAEAQAGQAELNRALTGGVLYPLGRLYWLQGRTDEARQVYRQMSALEVRLPLVNALQKMLGGLLELSAKRYGRAEAYLLEAQQLQSGEGVSEIYGSARLLLAYLYYRWERPQEALAHLEALLARCEKEQTAGTILQDMPLAAPLLRLAAKKGLRAGQAAALLQRMGLPIDEEEQNTLLTPRQLEILRLMSAGYSNQAIADALVLSLATVKSHAVHILNRLGVSSRMEAVARARLAGLL